MTWEAYAKQLLSEEDLLDKLKITLNEHGSAIAVPPVIKASLRMLERTKGSLNAFVFPERIQPSFLMVLLRAINDIAAGRMQSNYDPDSFIRGDTLKLQNSKVRFERIEDGKIVVSTSDNVSHYIPLHVAPFFQRTTAKRLTRDYDFSRESRLFREERETNLLSELKDCKTHLQSSIYYVTQIDSAKKLLGNSKLNGEPISDVLLLGQANSEGKINSIMAGQFSGKPAIVLASELYYVVEACKKTPAHMVVVEVSSPTIVENKLDEIDQLRSMDIPLLFIADTANSFYLQDLRDRGCNLWRWDRQHLLPLPVGNTCLSLDLHQRNCINQTIDYISVDSLEISTGITSLYAHKSAVEEAPASQQDIMESLLSVGIMLLRKSIPLLPTEKESIRQKLISGRARLDAEMKFMDPTLFSDLQIVIGYFLASLEAELLPKADALQQVIHRNDAMKTCVVVSDKDKDEKVRIAAETHLIVLCCSEYLASKDDRNTAIILGWLGKDTMRKLLHSCKSANYIVFLYHCEQQWRKASERYWHKVLDNNSNREMLPDIQDSNQTQPVQQETENGVDYDDLEILELVLQKSRYKRCSGTRTATDALEKAVPVSFIGDYISFYRSGHRVLTVTGIIEKRCRTIEEKYPQELAIGDFVVLRDSQRALIQAIADQILDNSGLKDARRTASRWKDTLKVVSLFTPEKELFAALRKAGCQKGNAAMRSWLMDDDMILPRDKSDLEAMALATEDAILLETIDAVFEAGIEVRRAHLTAGSYLSRKLDAALPKAIVSMDDFEPYDIWEPIFVELEGVGQAQIFKVIDIGQPVEMDPSYLDRLITSWEG